ncbi:hypothetical protein ACJX0J_001467 [Zea mays]
MLSIACVDQFLVAFSLVDSYFIVWRNNFFYYNIILNQTDMYISKRFSSEVKSTKVTQKMDKIVSVTNKNIYRESLLTSSKLENFIKIKYFVFLFNEYQALRRIMNSMIQKKLKRWIKLYKESWFQRKVKWGYGEIGRRYGLDCAETQWKLIIVNLFQSNIEESPILHCDKNSMNLMLFIK